jgi:2'-5' RNA ligase
MITLLEFFVYPCLGQNTRKGQTDIRLDPQEQSALFPVEAVLDKVVVFKSDLRPAGPVYTSLGTFTLSI